MYPLCITLSPCVVTIEASTPLSSPSMLLSSSRQWTLTSSPLSSVNLGSMVKSLPSSPTFCTSAPLLISGTAWPPPTPTVATMASPRETPSAPSCWLFIFLAIKHLFPWGYDRFANSLFFINDGMLICSSFSLNDNVAFLTDLYQNFLALLGVVSLTIKQTKLELKHFIAYDAHTSWCTFALIHQPPLNYSWKGKEYTIPLTEIWHYLGSSSIPILSSLITYITILVRASVLYRPSTCSETCAVV